MQDRGLFSDTLNCLQLLIMSAIIGTTTRILQLMYNGVPSSRSIFFILSTVDPISKDQAGKALHVQILTKTLPSVSIKIRNSTRSMILVLVYICLGLRETFSNDWTQEGLSERKPEIDLESSHMTSFLLWLWFG